jgi:hypothetical protein
MQCEECGKEIPPGSPTCPACGHFAMPRGANSPTLDDAVSEVKRAAKEFAAATASLSRHVVAKAGDAAKDPTGTAKRATRRAAEELDKAARDVERILRDL